MSRMHTRIQKKTREISLVFEGLKQSAGVQSAFNKGRKKKGKKRDTFSYQKNEFRDKSFTRNDIIMYYYAYIKI